MQDSKDEENKAYLFTLCGSPVGLLGVTSVRILNKSGRCQIRCFGLQDVESTVDVDEQCLD